MSIGKIQEELNKRSLDGWLFYDFHNRDLIAYSILGIDKNRIHSRKWYYFIPARGEPMKLVHNIESEVLDGLPRAQGEDPGGFHSCRELLKHATDKEYLKRRS